MIRKTTIAYLIFTLTVCYIITPWFFEKKLLINEILSVAGFFVLAYKRFKIGKDIISICMITLIAWCCLHLIISIPRQDSMYYYFRNSVIAYSMLTFFIGFYLLKYLGRFISAIRGFLQLFIGLFVFIKAPTILFERYGVSTIFPALFKNAHYRLLPIILIALNIIYGFTYDSATAVMIAVFLFFLFISPGYNFFRQTITVTVISFALLFFYLQPNLGLIKNQFSPKNNKAIKEVIQSHPILAIDGNTTWRLVIWKQIINDHFPANIFGLGFGTPMLKYFPIEDSRKLATLPYVMGAHNSFIYLFGRLGIVFILLILIIYISIFKEYFYNKNYYYSNDQILIFWSFFVITVIALFNPILESPLFACTYWMLLGFVARCIYNRKIIETKSSAAL